MSDEHIPDVEAIGVGLTAAYRKVLDGPVSVILHNVVQALPEDAWLRYVTELRARIVAAGRFDAESLMAHSLGAVDAIDWLGFHQGTAPRPKPHLVGLANVLRGAVRLVTPGQWVTLARVVSNGDDAREGAVGSPELGLGLMGRTVGRLAVETRMSVGGVDVVTIRWADPTVGGPEAKGWHVEVLGGWRDVPRRRAIDEAHVRHLEAEVDPVRVEAHRTRGLPEALDPADPADRLAVQAGAAGSLLHRRHLVPPGELGEPEAVEYLLASVEDGIVSLNGWRVRLAGEGGAPSEATPSLRSARESLAWKMGREGRVDLKFERDADMVRALLSVRQEGDEVVLRPSLVREVRDRGEPRLVREVLSSREVRLAGRCVPGPVEAAAG